MPGKVQLIKFGGGDGVDINAEAAQDLDQILFVKDVKADKRPSSPSNFFHSGRVFTSPRVCELGGVNGHVVTAEKRAYFSRNTASPINDGAKDIEQKSFDFGIRGHFLSLSIGALQQVYSPSAVRTKAASTKGDRTGARQSL
ncbi:hypothetical protein LMG27174_07082 [Paraburkholderia rhynchosiae]|uniref:Uncharacterized protein n=1 Tax=Paraburkholderia rhynchosiae TaxID=487049 RepID=A0A6J5CUH2_9BURK|nr:hypothetical protein LMG27174_07082 [Paraburkholderia rhynchosiae]